MKFKFGADVKNFDGEKIGTVKEVVLDPATQEITHLIIEKGLLFREDRVLPISLIMKSTEEEIKLVDTDQELKDLPEYHDEYFVPIEAGQMHNSDLVLSRNFLISKPRIVPQKQADVRFIKSEEYQSHLPEESKMVEIGTEVFSLEEETIGRIREVVLDFKTNQITHLVLDRALLQEDQILIPFDWVDTITEGHIKLLVDQQVIENLPPYLEEA